MSISTPLAYPWPSVQRLEQIFSVLPPLKALFETWDLTGAKDFSPTLILREEVLGAATLPSTSLQLLYQIAATHLHQVQADKDLAHREKCPLHQRLVWHEATRSPEETQAILPSRVLVQKTILVEMDGRLILCSGAGAQRVTRTHLHHLAAKLSLSRQATKRCTLNPATCDPIKEFEMLPGMVSPFLRPQRPTRLSAVVLLPWAQRWEEQGYEVAISLSLWESVLLPLRCLKPMLFSYARQAYPGLPVIALQPPALDEREEQNESWSQRSFVGISS